MTEPQSRARPECVIWSYLPGPVIVYTMGTLQAPNDHCGIPDPTLSQRWCKCMQCNHQPGTPAANNPTVIVQKDGLTAQAEEVWLPNAWALYRTTSAQANSVWALLLYPPQQKMLGRHVQGLNYAKYN